MITIDEARVKLEEYPHWRNVSGLVDFEYSDEYFITLDNKVAENENHAPQTRLYKIACQQVDGIFQTVNKIKDKTCRGYLIMYYLAPPLTSYRERLPKTRRSRKRILFTDFRKLLGIKNNVAKSAIEQEALSAFALHYQE